MLRGKYRVPFYMSTDCEGILRRFLVLNPAKRCTLEVRRTNCCLLLELMAAEPRAFSFQVIYFAYMLSILLIEMVQYRIVYQPKFFVLHIQTWDPLITANHMTNNVIF